MKNIDRQVSDHEQGLRNGDLREQLEAAKPHLKLIVNNETAEEPKAAANEPSAPEARAQGGSLLATEFTAEDFDRERARAAQEGRSDWKDTDFQLEKLVDEEKILAKKKELTPEEATRLAEIKKKKDALKEKKFGPGSPERRPHKRSLTKTERARLKEAMQGVAANRGESRTNEQEASKKHTELVSAIENLSRNITTLEKALNEMPDATGPEKKKTVDLIRVLRTERKEMENALFGYRTSGKLARGEFLLNKLVSLFNDKDTEVADKTHTSAKPPQKALIEKRGQAPRTPYTKERLDQNVITNEQEPQKIETSMFETRESKAARAIMRKEMDALTGGSQELAESDTQQPIMKENKFEISAIKGADARQTPEIVQQPKAPEVLEFTPEDIDTAGHLNRVRARSQEVAQRIGELAEKTDSTSREEMAELKKEEQSLQKEMRKAKEATASLSAYDLALSKHYREWKEGRAQTEQPEIVSGIITNSEEAVAQLETNLKAPETVGTPKESMEALAALEKRTRSTLAGMEKETETRAEKAGMLDKVRAIGEWYKKQPMHYKVLFATGLALSGAGAAIAGSAAFGAATATLGAGSRMIAGASLFVGMEEMMRKSHEKKTGVPVTSGAAARHTVFAGALAIVVGSMVPTAFHNVFEGAPSLASTGPAETESAKADNIARVKAEIAEEARLDELGQKNLVALEHLETKATDGEMVTEDTAVARAEKIQDLVNQEASRIIGDSLINQINTMNIPPELQQQLAAEKTNEKLSDLSRKMTDALFNGDEEEALKYNSQMRSLHETLAARLHAAGVEVPEQLRNGEFADKLMEVARNAAEQLRTEPVTLPEELPGIEPTGVEADMMMQEAEQTLQQISPEIIPADPQMIAQAQEVTRGHLNELFGTKGFFGFGATEGATSATWSDPDVGFANKTVNEILNATPTSYIADGSKYFTKEGAQLFGINDPAATQKMQGYLKLAMDQTGIKPMPNETAAEFIDRAALTSMHTAQTNR